jgi:hypothetical protein
LGSVTEVTTAWMDRAWDDEASLLWNPPGAFEGVVDEPRAVHLVRETAWYAIGLLRRDGPGDRARAERALTAVAAQQYDAPGQPWHGTFVRFPEWPAPREGAVEWIDYDPNWRQFVGTALAVAITDFGLSDALRDRLREVTRLAVESEPPDRVAPTYANIALLRSWLEAWTGAADEDFRAAVVDAFRENGCFIEYGSPTYYGIDLLALGLWRRPDAPDAMQRAGADIEGALWADVARWWHAGLGNLCGPYSRAYGMDAHTHVTGLSLALWCAGLPAPLPDLGAEAVVHGHDLCEGPMLEHGGVRVPTAVRGAFERFTGPRRVDQVISATPRREASGWLEDALMIGAETGDSGLHARGQFHPATVHWRQPDGQVGWIRVEHRGATRAVANERRLEVECDGPHPIEWVTDAPVDVTPAGGWHLPGLAVEVDTDATPTDDRALRYDPKPGPPTRFTLRLTPTPELIEPGSEPRC